MSTRASGEEQVFRLLLNELGESLSLPKLLEPGQDDSSHVLFDEKIAVEFRRDANWLVLFSALGEFDTAHRPDLALGLLGANLFWQGTAGATLGVSTTGLVVLSHRIPLAELNLPKLRDVLERFVRVAERWHRELRQPAVAADAMEELETTSHEFLRA